MAEGEHLNEHRILQGETDWPLSARHEEFKNVADRRQRKVIKSD